MPSTFNVTFPSGHGAIAAHVQNPADLVEAVAEMGLIQRNPIIVLVGGADGLQPNDLDRLRPIFSGALIPLAQRLGATVVDGGTDSGVMSLMGQARNKAGADFPLIGVLPARMVTLPQQSPHGTELLGVEPNHTHFILVPGSRWGDESPWMTSIVEAIAGDSPSLTVLVDGGETAWEDVAESVRAGRRVIVVDGSGRVADILAAALAGTESEERALSLVSSGLLRAVGFDQGPTALREAAMGIISSHQSPSRPDG